ncbi:MAG: cyanobactin biosynthesis PatC/TenC/TruC family protein [Symploca sp. SIO1B1]|nr:cyanobactin biosynthesis PatC/TenC/TruC family protein [Symploca sp. SIO1B1]
MTNLQSVLTFDGEENYIEISNPFHINFLSSCTLEVWLKSPSIGPMFSATQIFEYGTLVGQSMTVSDTLYAQCGLRDKSGKWVRMSTREPLPQDNGWHHIAFVFYEGNEQEKIFIDGELYSQYDADPCTRGFAGGAMRIGFGFKDPQNNLKPCYFKGQLAEIRYWNKALSQSEIQAGLHRRLWGNEPALTGYWCLNEGSGTIVRDKTSHASHGTIFGCTWDTTDTLPVAPLPKKQTSVTNPDKQYLGTGLQDYGYWYKWKQNLPQQTDSQPFRRGRIWS